MPFKTNANLVTYPRLSSFTLLEVSGPDSAAFLQAQTMNDVLALNEKRWQWNGWLNAKGRLIALFALLRMDTQKFILVLPDYPAIELMPRLQRFVFRAKVQLKVCDDFIAAGDFTQADTASSATRDEINKSQEIGFWLDLAGNEKSRRLYLLAPEHPALAPPSPENDDRWLVSDITYGLPRLPISQSEQWTPQMLSLQQLDAFSLKKGCYPGQEIVARTHFLGQAKRALFFLNEESLATGVAISDSAGQAIGSVVCTNSNGQKGLAILPQSVAADSWLGGNKIRPSLPQTGLERPAKQSN